MLLRLLAIAKLKISNMINTFSVTRHPEKALMVFDISQYRRDTVGKHTITYFSYKCQYLVGMLLELWPLCHTVKQAKRPFLQSILSFGQNYWTDAQRHYYFRQCFEIKVFLCFCKKTLHYYPLHL